MNQITTKDWIEKYDFKDNYYQIGESRFHELKMPKSINNDCKKVYEYQKVQCDNPYFNCVLKDMTISCNDNGISGTSFKTCNGYYLNDLSNYWSEGDNKSNIYYSLSPKFPTVFIGEKWGGWNYFHYVFSSLPKLAFYLKNISFDRIIHNSIKKKFVKDSLTYLGINLDSIICMDDYPKIVVQKLNAVSPIGWGVNPNRESCFKIRDLFKNEFQKGKRKIYISRKNSSSRKLLNEDQIIDFLLKQDFEIIFLENMDFIAQVKLFSESEIVIAPHGAGLTNLVWCNSGTKVIEIQSPLYVGLCYWLVSNSVDLDYHYVVGNGFDSNNPWKDGSSDYIVDLNNFKKEYQNL